MHISPRSFVISFFISSVGRLLFNSGVSSTLIECRTENNGYAVDPLPHLDMWHILVANGRTSMHLFLGGFLSFYPATAPQPTRGMFCFGPIVLAWGAVWLTVVGVELLFVDPKGVHKHARPQVIIEILSSLT